MYRILGTILGAVTGFFLLVIVVVVTVQAGQAKSLGDAIGHGIFVWLIAGPAGAVTGALAGWWLGRRWDNRREAQRWRELANQEEAPDT